jgi:hypothetical protein
MPSQFPTNPAYAPGQATTPETVLPNLRRVSRKQQLQRWAELVAHGGVPVPDGLTPGEQEWLLRDVARRRRARLVQYIARAIALDIHRSRNA